MALDVVDEDFIAVGVAEKVPTKVFSYFHSVEKRW